MISNEAEFKKELAHRQQETEDVIRAFLPKEEGHAERVIEAMNYSVEAGGKRLRPLFIREVSRMYGVRAQLREPFMAALEMIHTYSLVHDDLPALDNDQYRRGRKTTWAVYGDDMAVIAGDGLLNYAYETALKALREAKDREETLRVTAALELLAKNAGIYGMVGGQCADLQTDRDPSSVDEETLLYIHRNKTAALIDSGLVIGAVLGGAPESDVRSLHAIAQNIGLAFQIEDDILDVTGNAKELGKSVGKDAQEGKVTYVSMHGLDASREQVRKLTDESLKLFDSLSVSDDFLRDVLEMLVTRTR